MTTRTIITGETPTVIIRAGGSARIEGTDGDRVVATTESRWGLKLERRGDSIEVESGGSCTVRLPFASEIRVYTGKDAEIFDIRNRIAIASVGGHLTIERSNRLAHAQSGRSMKIDCEAFETNKVKFEAGGNIHCHIANLADTNVMIQDLGGKWEVGFGSRQRILQLKCGGDATLVTDHTPDELPEVFGQIEVHHPGEQ
jgi:hypothetical protein